MLRPLDLTDDPLAERVVAIQQVAYRVEADLIGFDGIPPLHDTVSDVQTHRLKWLGSFDGETLAGVIAWSVDDGVCDIDRLAVDPGFARRGHGRRLVASVLTHPTVVVSTGTANAPSATSLRVPRLRRHG